MSIYYVNGMHTYIITQEDFWVIVCYNLLQYVSNDILLDQMTVLYFYILCVMVFNSVMCSLFSYSQWLSFAKQKLQFTEELAWMWVMYYKYVYMYVYLPSITYVTMYVYT